MYFRHFCQAYTVKHTACGTLLAVKEEFSTIEGSPALCLLVVLRVQSIGISGCLHGPLSFCAPLVNVYFRKSGISHILCFARPAKMLCFIKNSVKTLIKYF